MPTGKQQSPHESNLDYLSNSLWYIRRLVFQRVGWSTLLRRFGPAVLPVVTQVTNKQNWLAFIAQLGNHRIKLIREFIISIKYSILPVEKTSLLIYFSLIARQLFKRVHKRSNYNAVNAINSPLCQLRWIIEKCNQISTKTIHRALRTYASTFYKQEIASRWKPRSKSAHVLQVLEI